MAAWDAPAAATVHLPFRGARALQDKVRRVRYADRRDDRSAVHVLVNRRIEADAAEQGAPHVAVSHGTDDLSIALDHRQLQVALIDAPQRLNQGRVFPDNEYAVHD